MQNSVVPSAWFSLGIVSCLLSLSGCLSHITLTRAVIAYDEAITESQGKQLLELK